MTTHHYISWLRLGIAATRGGGAVTGVNPTVAATISIDGTATPMSVTLHGPGDIAALSSDAIVRRDPAPSSLGVSVSVASVRGELWPADLPWRFSPAASRTPTGAVSRGSRSWWWPPRRRSVRSRARRCSCSRRRVPSYRIRRRPGHGHIAASRGRNGGIPGAVGTYVRDHADTAVARLLCARKLAPDTAYRACLVPLYEAGRRAGLGQDASSAGTALAWTATADPSTQVVLPIYDSWLFTTGDLPDFETLARRLRARASDAAFPPLSVDVTAVAPGPAGGCHPSGSSTCTCAHAFQAAVGSGSSARVVGRARATARPAAGQSGVAAATTTSASHGLTAPVGVLEAAGEKRHGRSAGHSSTNGSTLTDTPSDDGAGSRRTIASGDSAADAGRSVQRHGHGRRRAVDRDGRRDGRIHAGDRAATARRGNAEPQPTDVVMRRHPTPSVRRSSEPRACPCDRRTSSMPRRPGSRTARAGCGWVAALVAAASRASPPRAWRATAGRDAETVRAARDRSADLVVHRGRTRVVACGHGIAG